MAKKKPHRGMTTEEAIHALFPKHVIKRVRREIHGQPPPKPSKGAKKKES